MSNTAEYEPLSLEELPYFPSIDFQEFPQEIEGLLYWSPVKDTVSMSIDQSLTPEKQWEVIAKLYARWLNAPMVEKLFPMELWHCSTQEAARFVWDCRHD
jgi:hypothetical protein